MNQNIIIKTAKAAGVTNKQVEVVNGMLAEGNTIPFISRYRKEATGGLDENQIKTIADVFAYEKNLQDRKDDVIRLIDEKQMLTPELKAKVLSCNKLVDVEDIYRPFKEKKKTKATEAIAKGLEPLANMIMKFDSSLDPKAEAKSFVGEKVKTVEEAIEGAGYIIAEQISDNAFYRKSTRQFTFKNGNIVTKKKKSAVDENNTFEMYYDFNEPVTQIKSHRVLAIQRAVKEKIISFKIDVAIDRITDNIELKVLKNENSKSAAIVKAAIKDSYKRLISPSIEREIWGELIETAETGAIGLFAKNLSQLLLAQPVKGQRILGFDPAFRTGCKLAVVDEFGKMESVDVIYPHATSEKNMIAARKRFIEIVKQSNIDLVAIGNGTASRESEDFVAKIISEENLDIKYIIVNEAGASVYSASKEAQKEFPDLQVEQRSAISIARRIQEPLSELIKIDPKSIGVGQYQHDVNQKKLNENLGFVVESAVNNVGVNVNTASTKLLSYISGVTAKIAQNIIDLRDEIGNFKDRKEIKKAKGLGPKAYEQAAGFLRILDGSNPLDKTPIHPESYKLAKLVMKELKITASDLGTDKVVEVVNNLTPEKIESFGSDKYTMETLLESFKKPLQDPRDNASAPLFKSGVLKIDDLQNGMHLIGVVRNITDFGAFIDVGLKSDGMAHISQLKKGYVKHPMDVVSVGDQVECWVFDVDKKRNRVALTLVNGNEK